MPFTLDASPEGEKPTRLALLGVSVTVGLAGTSCRGVARGRELGPVLAPRGKPSRAGGVVGGTERRPGRSRRRPRPLGP